MAKLEAVGLEKTIPQHQVPQVGDTYQFIRDIFLSTGVVTSEVADGAAAVAFDFVSPAYVTGGAKLVSVKNDVTEVLSVDKDGNVALTGTVDGRDIAADGVTLDAAGFTTDADTQITPATAIVLDHATNNEIALDLEYTVNKAGGTDTGLRVNQIDTASPSTSLLAHFTVNGADKFRFFNTGALVVTGLIQATTDVRTPDIHNSSAATLEIQDTSFPSAGNVVHLAAGTHTNSSGALNAVVIKPTYNQSSTANATDLLIDRTEIAVGSGAQLLQDWQVGSVSQASMDTSGMLSLDSLTLATAYTVATLPAAVVGKIARITDGDAALAWGATAVNSGGASTPYLVFYNGTNWTIMAK